MATSITKVPISLLPLPPSTHILTQNLTPDPITPSPRSFQKVLREKPSAQRRARLLSPESHFSFVSPLPLPFPYKIEIPPHSEGNQNEQVSYVEKWLSNREPLHRQARSSPDSRDSASSILTKYYSENRDQLRELVGLSITGLNDCLPNLDVGDAFATLGNPTLSQSFDEEGEPSQSQSATEVSARQELIDVLSGHTVLMSSEETPSEASFAPWSLRYSGHQFGVWAGQLGDGRAISILATRHPSDPDLTYELQLKGSGRTPFSRSADGLAVVRSSIREFLCAEAMHALSIPTTRSLSLIHLPGLPVYRETLETGCILTRVAPSFIRIGSFEALNPPSGMFFLGGGQQDAHWEALRILGEWVSKRVLRLDCKGGEAWGEKLVMEVAIRNAKMVASWQAYGFMHGVINTDNVSVLGLTIDYGPYAFMDVFNPFHICNHSDGEGRYAYKYQPQMIIFALEKLLDALSPLIGAEIESGKAVQAGWADGASGQTISEWRRRALEVVKDKMNSMIQDVCSTEYGMLMRKRLALRRQDPTDEREITGPLLDIMQRHKLDFHSTFRKLSFFQPSLLESSDDTASDSQSPLKTYISELLSVSPETQTMDHSAAAKDWMTWLDKYAKRIESERGEWSGNDVDDQREKAAKSANPRFILRQWVLEEVIRKVERDADSGKRLLGKVLKMACEPFEPWGAEGSPAGQVIDAEAQEERRYCGLGAKNMLGFQCSCSS